MSSTENAGTDTRTRILRATLDLLESGQTAKLRMADIARAAGVSRQALYLHFANRTELLADATRYQDDALGTPRRLAPSRTAATGTERLDAFVAAWTAYVPEIYPAARALLALYDSDAEAAAAWDERMADMREGCEAAVQALARDGMLAPGFTEAAAADMLWALLSVRNWELLVKRRGWSQKTYEATLLASARKLFVGGAV